MPPTQVKPSTSPPPNYNIRTLREPWLIWRAGGRWSSAFQLTARLSYTAAVYLDKFNLEARTKIVANRSLFCWCANFSLLWWNISKTEEWGGIYAYSRKEETGAFQRRSGFIPSKEELIHQRPSDNPGCKVKKCHVGKHSGRMAFVDHRGRNALDCRLKARSYPYNPQCFW